MSDYEHWEFDPEYRTIFDPDKDGLVIATVEPSLLYDNIKNVGRLLAAAPEMYWLLEGFCCACACNSCTCKDREESVDATRKLLARINGKESCNE